MRGVGEDRFFLNSFSPQDILEFKTLYDYDLADHGFQEEARKKETPEYAVKPYRGRLYYEWARLFIDGKFYYAGLSMAACRIYREAESFGDEKLLALMPHRYVDGEEHGKREGSGFIFSQRLSANGKEGQVEELQRRLPPHLSDRFEALLSEFDAQGRKAVYMYEDSDKGEPHMSFYFSDKTALQAVRFRHFMSDCRSLIAPYAELEPFIERERQAIGAYLEAAARDIMENFDPKIAKFRKKRKIIISEGALNDLF